MANDPVHGRSGIDDAELRTGLTIGVAVGVPAAVAVGAFLALVRSVFDATNAALVLMIVVVGVAAIGGRAAGIVTALAAVASFDFFHTKPYLSLAISSRDDIKTTILLLAAAVIVGTIASSGRHAQRRAGSARSEVRRIHRVAEAAHDGRARPRIGRNGAVEGMRDMRFGRQADGAGGFELPAEGVDLPVLARGQHIGRFVLVPTPGVAVSLEQRIVAVAIADQVASVWVPDARELRREERSR